MSIQRGGGGVEVVFTCGLLFSAVILAIVVLYFNGQALREGITVSTSDSPSHHGSLEDLFIHLFQVSTA